MIAFDTNVLVYAVDNQAGQRHVSASTLVAQAMKQQALLILLQSLVEFHHVTTRKRMITPIAARGFIEGWRAAAPVHAYTEEDLMAAIDAVDTHRLAFFDALLCATAARIGVRQLVTEDQQHGRKVGPVTYLSPFAPDTAERLGLA